MSIKLPNHLLTQLQKQLGYRFVQPTILIQALTHRSYSAQNNERLEFIGDSILNYSVAKMLFDAFPSLSEGELSRLRSSLVNQDTLAQIAMGLKLGDVLLLGEGELKSGGFRRPSILADAVEAIFAAVSFDSDFLKAEQVVRHLFCERIKNIDIRHQGKDDKTSLQEALQARKLALPKYRILAQKGEAHEQIFVVECDLGELAFISKGEGSSRRQAEQLAAKDALIYIEQNFPLGKKKNE
ncbi:ribonuclease III [Neisseria sp. Ec49-e6-T10]|uniref:ribonuclease III n=1 Tax=Neisseria sp. Ec49-e6-T10 TaxID=3140744 RepID=UPI003EBE1102